MIVGPCPTWLFDCDGVLLDSNSIKVDAFRRVALRFGADVADQLVAYHREHGGVSRYAKFAYLLEHLLHRPAGRDEIAALARDYGESMRDELLRCPEAPGLREFLARRPPGTRWYVVSGADELELREIFDARGLTRFFDGVYGSPRTKLDIFRALEVGGEAVMFGDSRYDHEASHACGIPFVFVSGFTEFTGWQAYCATNRIAHVTHLSDVELR